MEHVNNARNMKELQENTWKTVLLINVEILKDLISMEHAYYLQNIREHRQPKKSCVVLIPAMSFKEQVKMVHVYHAKSLRELKKVIPKHVCHILVSQDKYMETWVIVSIALITKEVKTITPNVDQIHALEFKNLQQKAHVKIVNLIINLILMIYHNAFQVLALTHCKNWQ